MFALFTPALLLLASAVKVQGQTPSVATFISISPTPTSEGLFTIQTSVPGGSTLSEGSMGIPPGETPIPSSLLSIITDPLLSTTPAASPSASASTSASASASSSANVTASVPLPSRPGVPPPQQSTGASPSLQAHGTPFKIVLAVSGLTLMGTSLVFL